MPSNRNNLTILFTSSGRRMSLLQKFRSTFAEHNSDGRLLTADLRATAPTAFVSDKHFIVPRVNAPDYVPELLNICRTEGVDLLIPLIDTELPLLAASRDRFEEAGTRVLVSSPELNDIACDKTKTYAFFTEHGIATPKVYTDEELAAGGYALPLLIKPLDGSSSLGVTKIRNERELAFFKEYVPNAMVQEFVTGREYTVDVMVDWDGNIKTIVPRLRIETRAGEVSKGVTRKDEAIIDAVRRVVRTLPGPVGCITLQCFKRENDEITFIEINPRFGGGVPLAIEAGADFPLWVLQMCRGERFTEEDFGWRPNLTMLRYDEAVFTESIAHEH